MTYANIEDLEAGWRQLLDDEKSRATSLLERASIFLDEIVNKYHIDVEAKAQALKFVCCDLVQRKLENASALPVKSETQQAGPFMQTRTYSFARRKSWELYPEDLEFLGVRSSGAGSIKVAIHNKGGEEIDW